MKIRRRHIISAILFMTFLSTFAVSDSYGQTIDINVQNAIERNEELLKEAEVLVRSTNSVKARASLETAKKLHEASKRSLTPDNVLSAARLAGQAREAIVRTIAIAKREAKLEENALKTIERASIRNERARALLDELGGPGDQPAKKLVEESRHQLGRAKNNVREHMFEVALHLANASIELSNRAIKMLRRNAVVPEKVVREIARTDRLLERADEQTGRQPSPILREAHEIQGRAKTNARQSRFRLALEQTQRARILTRQVLKHTADSKETGRDNVVNAIELTDRFLGEAYEIAREGELAAVIEKLDEASRIQQNAKDKLESGQYKSALRLTLQAREMAKKAMRTIDKPIAVDRVKQALEKTDQILARTRSALEDVNDNAAEALYARAASRQATAWDAFESGQLKRALANSKIARNLAKKALRQLGDD